MQTTFSRTMLRMLSYGNALGLLLVLAGMAVACGSVSRADAQTLLWQIGKPDNDDREFALAPKHYDQFREDGFFVIGKSDPARDWPYVHPGPVDGWAGGRAHTFIIVFGLQRTRRRASASCSSIWWTRRKACRRSCVFKSTARSSARTAPRRGRRLGVRRSVEGPRAQVCDCVSGRATQGGRERDLAHHALRLLAALRLAGAGDPGRAGTGRGHRHGRGHTPVASGARRARRAVAADGQGTRAAFRRAGAGTRAGRRCRSAGRDSAARSGDVRSERARRGGNQVGQRVCRGRWQSTRRADRSRSSPFASGSSICCRIRTWISATRTCRPTSRQAQWKYLEMAMDTARKSAGNPPGSRFKWNVEVLWAVDSYLKQATPEKREQFIEAVKAGQVGLQALYGNELTGLCRPEELLRLLSCASGSRSCARPRSLRR